MINTTRSSLLLGLLCLSTNASATLLDDANKLSEETFSPSSEANTLAFKEANTSAKAVSTQAYDSLLTQLMAHRGFEEKTTVDAYERRFQHLAPQMNDASLSEVQRTKLWAHFMLSWFTVISVDEENGTEQLLTIEDIFKYPKKTAAESEKELSLGLKDPDPFHKNACLVSHEVICRTDKLLRLVDHPWSTYRLGANNKIPKEDFALPRLIQGVIDSFISNYHYVKSQPMCRCLEGARKHRRRVLEIFRPLLKDLTLLAHNGTLK